MSDGSQVLTEDIRARVAALGFELVDLHWGGGRTRTKVQIRVDRPDATPGAGITIEECASVSRSLEAWLDASGALGQRYVLEVSSPGIERPVRWREHWERFVGRDVNVTVADRGRLRATIVAVDADRDEITLQVGNDAERFTVLREKVKNATLAVDW